MNVRKKDGERKQEMQDRRDGEITTQLDENQEKSEIASHGRYIRYMLKKYGKEKKKMPNTALFKLVYDNGLWSYEQL